jgi:hypothetical protein
METMYGGPNLGQIQAGHVDINYELPGPPQQAAVFPRSWSRASLRDRAEGF